MFNRWRIRWPDADGSFSSRPLVSATARSRPPPGRCRSHARPGEADAESSSRQGPDFGGKPYLGRESALKRSGDASPAGNRTQRQAPVVTNPIQVVADSPLLRSVDRSSLHGLESELEWIVVGEQEVLHFDGERGDALYFVASGRLDVVQSWDEEVGAGETTGAAQGMAAIIAGDVIGEMRTLTGSRESAAVRGVTASRLVRLEKARLDRYLSTHPQLAENLRNAFLPMFYRNEIVRVLRVLFGVLSEDMLADIERLLTWRHVMRGEALFRQGESSDGLFVVVSGRLREVRGDDAHEERAVGDLVQGEIAGEMGIFADEIQTTSVVAVRDSILLRFSRDNFRELSARYPTLNEWLVRYLSKRLHGVIHEIPPEHLCTNILLVGAGDGVSLEEIAQRLSDSLSRHAPCLLLSSARTDTLLGAPGIAVAEEGSPDDLRLRAWLNGQETRCRFVVYVADPGLTNWTRRCIRQADEVMSFGVAGGVPSLTETEAEVVREEKTRHAGIRKTLVLLHPPGTLRPRGTMHWLRVRRVDRHLHVRSGRQDDFDRIVRYVLRREVGLVLSGGGSRGFAHAGIIRAMREAGLPVDVVAGVSMGSLIGAGCAFSEDLDETVVPLRQRIGRMLTDYTLPFVSLARGRRFDRGVKALFGDTNIEDLWLPYFCVSSNLTRASTVVHRSGLLWRAIRASSSLPGVIPPVIENGDMLYDGCLLNNLPVDLMREEIETGLLIAVDVVPPVDLDVHATELENPSGWRLAWSRVSPFAKAIQFPDIVSIINRAGVLGSVRQRQQLIDGEHVDLYLRPPLGDFKILDFSVADEAFEIGYTYAVTEIAAWTKRGRRAGLLEPVSRTGT